MKYVQALISFGLFGWLAWAIATENLPGGEGGSSKTRALKAAIATVTDEIGTYGAAAVVAAAGLLLGLFFLSRES